MTTRQTLPLLWLLSDARNDALLEQALERLPQGSGFIFRHYHLDAPERRARFSALEKIARSRGHLVLLSGSADEAHEWDADGIYGSADRLDETDDLLRLATAHDGGELESALAKDADGIFLSPVFPTLSHPDAALLGVHGFHALAKLSSVPVIALGGMTHARAEELDWPRWGAIDGLVSAKRA